MVIDEWKFEPNTMFFQDSGLKCKIIRRKQGHLTGYVLINKNYLHYGKNYDDLFFFLKDNGIRVNAELSYSDFMDDEWAFGFAYASINDYIPEIDGQESNEDMPQWFNEFNSILEKELNISKEYKNIEQVIKDVKELAHLLSQYKIKASS